MSEYVCQSFFDELTSHIHLESTVISHARCRGGEGRGQMRTSGGQGREISGFVIRHAILPAAKHDANPFEGQGPDRGMVFLAALALALVIDTRPNRLRDRVSRPFVKALPQKLGTGPAKMHPFLLSAALRYRRNPAVFLYLCRTPITIALRTKSG